MENSQSSVKLAELRAYSQKHSSALLLLQSSALDYSAARCLLINGHFPGLVLGAQSIEKILKAYLLLKDSSMKVRNLKHDLGRLLKQVDTSFPQLGLVQFEPIVKRFREHYQARYPDNLDASTSMGTDDLRPLDQIIVNLNEHLPCLHNTKYRSGLYAIITSSIRNGGTVFSWENWIKSDNYELAPLLPRIALDYSKVMRELYPATHS